MSEEPPLQVPFIDPPLQRDVQLADTIEEQESDIYIARHNSIVNALGNCIDGAMAEAEFPSATLSKGLAFEVVGKLRFLGRWDLFHIRRYAMPSVAI